MQINWKTKLILKVRKIQSGLLDIIWEKNEWVSLFFAALFFPLITKFVQFYLDRSILSSELTLNSNLARIFFSVGWVIVLECILLLFFRRFFAELCTDSFLAAIYQGLKEIKLAIIFTFTILLFDFLPYFF